jgi:hypothetical protein
VLSWVRGSRPLALGRCSAAAWSSPSNQTVEVIFEPALSAFVAGLSADQSAFRIQVALKGLDRTRAVNEANVGIRPQQVQRIADDPGFLVLGSPKTWSGISCPLHQAAKSGLGAAIDMYLPDHVSKRLVIISALRHQPREAIAPMNASGFAGVKGAMAIINLELRYGGSLH